MAGIMAVIMNEIAQMQEEAKVDVEKEKKLKSPVILDDDFNKPSYDGIEEVQLEDIPEETSYVDFKPEEFDEKPDVAEKLMKLNEFSTTLNDAFLNHPSNTYSIMKVYLPIQWPNFHPNVI